VYICSCFGITEAQVHQHVHAGRRTPRAIAGACRAGTDCGSCVRRIQALLGRAAGQSAALAAAEAAFSLPAAGPQAAPAVV
jgi:bacterioferritin-associated ferredoxin